MKEIKWKTECGYVRTTIGSVSLWCEATEFWYDLESGEVEPGGMWKSLVLIGLSGPKIFGPNRRKLSKCKEDAIALACQLIKDAKTIVDEQVGIFERRGLL